MILCCHVSVQYKCVTDGLMLEQCKSLALLSTIQFVTTLQVCTKWLHWWDSIGIMFTAGTLDWYNNQYIGRESVDTWPIYWSTVSQHLVDSQSTVGQQSVDSWSTNCFFQMGGASHMVNHQIFCQVSMTTHQYPFLSRLQRGERECNTVTWLRLKLATTVPTLTEIIMFVLRTNLKSCNPFIPKISLVILLTVYHTIRMMLVWKIWYSMNYKYPNWNFPLVSSLVCLILHVIVRRNSILVTHGNERVHHLIGLKLSKSVIKN